MTPALLALTNPLAYPAAALARLRATGQGLTAASRLADPAAYGVLLAKQGLVAERVADIMPGLMQSAASEAEMAAVANAERVARAGARLWDEVARRSQQRARYAAMGWACFGRRLVADVALVRREFAPTAYLGVDWTYSLERAPIRILPGAEPALTTLADDPLTWGASWDLSALAGLLSAWVLVT